MADHQQERPGEPLGGADRRGFLKGTAAAALGAGAAAVAGPASAAAAERTHPDGLPPVGAEIPCSCLAVNTPLRIRTSLVTVDFRGGIKVRVETNPDDPENSVRLRVVGHRVSAELPGGDSADTSAGTITIEQNDVDVTPESVLRLTQKYPPRYEQVMVLRFTMTIDQPDEVLRRAGVRSPKAYEPLVLETKNPAVLVGTVTQFPPRGDVYRLQNPVDLVLPDDPDTVIATIEEFPVKVGGL
ncbi:twin-arginine translocation signal domain-containing protein [Actinosynnema sp. NPDC053489]|uniref:twin-arginine translocation signal domain-containing protein n=1 Tax=Actinosynnema sp. NPDC053489 TaxID=3363916 RepID=UPI0037C77316